MSSRPTDEQVISVLNMGPFSIRVGMDGVTAIRRTTENGQMALVPWFNVYHGETLWESVNAAHVHSVQYRHGEELF